MKHTRTQVAGICLMIAVLACQGWAQETAREDVSDRLAQRLAGSALTILRIKPLTPQALTTAASILDEVTKLAPNDVELWRLTLDVADLAEDYDLQSRAIRAIVQLDPADDVVRLRRILEVINNAQTVEEREAVFERLLEPQRIDEMGDAVASRLAFDYALLLRREGRVAAFGEQLARAVELDPSNRAAASLATGFFRSHVDDPYGETELLINLFLADPTTVDIQAAIARLALGCGAYDGAVRMYQLFTNCTLAMGKLVSTDQVADQAIALWGAGRVSEALSQIEQRQRYFNAAAQHQELSDDKEKTPIDVADVVGLMSPSLATVRAAILDRERDPHALESVELALRAYEQAMDQARKEEQKPPAEEFAAGFLELAWLTVWLGRDPDRASSYVQQAEALAELNDAARARFDGWIALRRGEFELASDRLAQTDEDDPAALIGRALILQQQNQNAGAARLLLRVAREQAGTVMGVWSAQMLYSIIGRRVSLDELPRRINELIGSLPSYIDRFPLQPSELYSVRIHSAQATYRPGEPIIVNIEISNNSGLSLGIDPDGPILPEMAIIPSMRVAQQTKLPPMDPIIISIDRRLRLEPKQRVIIPVDLRRYAVGSLMENYLLLGAFVRVKVIWNIRFSAASTVEPNLLGGESETLNFRVDGVRISLGWIEQALRDIEIIDRPEDVDTLIMLTHVPNYTLSNVTAEAVRPLEQKLPDALADGFTKLDSVRQALVLSELSPGPITQKLLETARTSEDRLVRIAYLLNVVQGGQDPMLAAGLRSDDPLVHAIALQLDSLAKRRQQAKENAKPAPAHQ